jgi:hypothetical protein
MKRLLLILPLIVTTPTPAAEPLSREEFAAIHRLIRPSSGEWKWAEVPWELSVKEARQKALKLGRPLMIVMSAQGSIAGCL